MSFKIMLPLSALLLLVGCTGGDDGGRDAASSPVRDDIDCTADVLGDTDETEMFSAHYVVDGELGPLCFGDEDPTLIQAFEELSTISPRGQLNDLGLFAGFVWNGGDDATLAFVTPIDDDGFQFLMAVGLDSYDDDPDEAKLTMAHEFAHVFTETITQLDRTAEPADCETHWNGSGCYLERSLMASWIAEFWPAGMLAAVDVDAELTGEASAEDGDERCALDDSFFGSYAASSPEEDFAEAFSAYVYDLDAATDGQQEKLDWIADQPGLVEFRTRAEGAGLTPLDNTFDVCG